MLTTGRYKGNPVVKHLVIPGYSARICSSAGWRFSMKPAASCSMRAISEEFRAKAVRIAESLKLALFYRPDRPWPPESTK